MEVTVVCKRSEKYVWMNRVDKIVNEKILGYKVTQKITRPDNCVVRDEVGNNINMSSDSHVGDQLLLCAKNGVPQKRISIKDKHLTLLPLVS